jgi:hypothetical protein
MQPAAFTRQLCLETPRDSFLRKYPHPWLLRELTNEERSAISISSFLHVRTTPYQTAPLVAPPGLDSARLAARLMREYYRFAVLPVVKGRASGWGDRILVGRGAGNDIVLVEPSVSKLHACLRPTPDGDWLVQDLGSANGTIVDGRRLGATSDPAPLRNGVLLQLGRQLCEFIASDELYDLLGTHTAAHGTMVA